MKSFLPVKEVSSPSVAAASPPIGGRTFPRPTEGVNTALPGKMLLTSPEAVAMQDHADSPQDLPFPPPLWASRPITSCKSQQVPKGKVCIVTHEEVCYTPKEQLEFSHLYKQKSGEDV